ncbi:MAG: hypothetical protein ACREMW_06015 [Gemmatimonadales bacterium]
MLLPTLWTRLILVLRGRRRAAPTAQLPRWSQVRRRRRAHIRRVAALVEEWAEAMGVSPRERGRWLTAVWLHDALRDARPSSGISHGAAAADRAARTA